MLEKLSVEFIRFLLLVSTYMCRCASVFALKRVCECMCALVSVGERWRATVACQHRCHCPARFRAALSGGHIKASPAGT